VGNSKPSLVGDSRYFKLNNSEYNWENFLGAYKVAQAEIFAGICGFKTIVTATMDGQVCKLAIQKLAGELIQVEPFKEISARRSMPRSLEMGIKHCTHAACPVPVGIIKAVEVEAKLALPADVSIKLTKTDG
jgi:hypothetical protein